MKSFRSIYGGLLTEADLPLGAPPGRYSHIKIPAKTSPLNQVEIDIQDVPRELMMFEEDAIAPQRRKKLKGVAQRTTTVQLNFGNFVRGLSMFMNLDTSFVCLFGTIASPIVLRPSLLLPKNTKVSTYYQSGPSTKVIHEFYLGNEHAPASVDWYLSRLDTFFAVDTNTKVIPGLGTLSVTAVVQGLMRRVNSDHSSVQMELVHREAHMHLEGNPEMHGLWRVAAHLSSQGDVNRVGLITDCSLGQLQAINARTIPLYADHYLPRGFELMYASAERGPTEYTPNKMMRMCDKASSDGLIHAQKTRGTAA